MERYEMEYLVDIFEEHSKSLMEMTNYNSDDLNLPCALKSVAQEIIELKNRLRIAYADVSVQVII